MTDRFVSSNSTTEAIAALPPTSSENNSSPARLPVADAQVTLGLLLKGDGVGRPGSWMALGVTPESKGMRGLDVAMLRWVRGVRRLIDRSIDRSVD